MSSALDQVRARLTAFYKLSDSRCEPEEYAAAFAPAGELESFAIGAMPSGKEPSDIVAWRSKAWDVVSSRHHRFHHVFPSTDDPREVAIVGDLATTKKDGGKAFTTFAAHLKFDDKFDKIRYYKVWLTPENPPQ